MAAVISCRRILPPPPNKQIKIEFDSTITAEVRSSDSWKPLSSGTEIAENTQLRLTIQKEITDGHIIVWTFGKTTLADKTKTLQHIADSSAAENGVITISYTIKATQSSILIFESSKMEVRREDNWQLLSSGTTVTEGEELRIEAKNLPAGSVVDTWKIGKTTRDARSHNTYRYCMYAGDAESENTITISYTVKTAQMFTLTFDEAKMIVQNYSLNPWQPLSNGAKVAEGTHLNMVAKDLPAGQTVDTWKTGKTTFPAGGKQIGFPLRTVDTENGTMNLSYTTRDIKQQRITFDDSKVTVKAWQQDSWQSLSSGETVEEETEIKIKAKDVPTGKVVDTWKVGKRTFTTNGGNQLDFSVHGSDAESGTINLSYTTKPE